MAKTKNKETDGLADTINDLAGQADEISITHNGHTAIVGNLAAFKKHLERTGIDNTRKEAIKKAMIVDGRRLEVEFTEHTSTGTDTHKKKCSAPVHPDLKKAFAALNDHLGRLCFQPITEHNPLHKEDKTQPALICPIHCVGFAISGNEDTEAVTLVGHRTLPNAKEIDLKSPSQKYDGDIYGYEFIGELGEAIMICIGEVELYLFPSEEWPKCKVEIDTQISLFPDDENDKLPE